MKYQKSSGNYPELKTITETMVNIVDKDTIREIEDGLYEWWEYRYEPSEYVAVLCKENDDLKSHINELADMIIDLTEES